MVLALVTLVAATVAAAVIVVSGVLGVTSGEHDVPVVSDVVNGAGPAVDGAGWLLAALAGGLGASTLAAAAAVGVLLALVVGRCRRRRTRPTAALAAVLGPLLAGAGRFVDSGRPPREVATALLLGAALTGMGRRLGRNVVGVRDP